MIYINKIITFDKSNGSTYYNWIVARNQVTTTKSTNRTGAHPKKLGGEALFLSSLKNSKKLPFTKDTKGDNGINPSSGYIGSTRFDLLVSIFIKDLGEIFDESRLKYFITETVKRHDSLIRNHGIVEGTDKWKILTSYSTALLEGRSVRNPDWVSTGAKDKWPKQLSHLRPLYHFIIDNNDNEERFGQVVETRRLMNTLFKLNRVCSANRTLTSLKELKLKFKLQPEMVGRFEKFAQTRLANVRESITLTDMSFDLFLGPSNGPNGVPKLESARDEAACLVRNKEMYEALQTMCVITNNNAFFDFFILRSEEGKGNLDSILLRKLTSIPDKANKSRIIAICDFWTQCIFNSVEKVIVKVTMQIFKKRCCFFSHSSGWDDIQSQTREVKERLVSLDATNWTDNLPASLQFIVMKALFGQTMAGAWKTLVVDCPWFVQPKTPPIYYGKGQGMGTKASFAIAQLTDLIFLEFSLSELYPDNQNPYFMKVGDDLVIEDPQMLIHERYEEIGVPINLSKSKFKTSLGMFTEFVSRNSWNNSDYSIISPGLVSKFIRNDHYGPTLYHHMVQRKPNISFSELFIMKKDFLLANSKLPAEKLEDRINTVLKLTTVIDLVAQSDLISDKDALWNNDSLEVKITFLKNIVLSTLGNIVSSASQTMKDRDARIAISKANLLLDRYNLDNKAFRLLDFILSNNMSLEDAAAATTTLPLSRKSRANYERGIRIELPELKLLLPSDNELNVLVTDSEVLSFILNIQNKQDQISMGYKTIKNLTMLDGRNIKTILQLYRFLNNAYKAKTLVLDLDTGQYLKPYKRVIEYEQLDPVLTGKYCELLGFHHILSQLDNINESATIRFGSTPSPVSIGTIREEGPDKANP
jgi:hypothetical protein